MPLAASTPISAAVGPASAAPLSLSDHEVHAGELHAHPAPCTAPPSATCCCPSHRDRSMPLGARARRSAVAVSPAGAALLSLGASRGPRRQAARHPAPCIAPPSATARCPSHPAGRCPCRPGAPMLRGRQPRRFGAAVGQRHRFFRRQRHRAQRTEAARHRSATARYSSHPAGRCPCRRARHMSAGRQPRPAPRRVSLRRHAGPRR